MHLFRLVFLGALIAFRIPVSSQTTNYLTLCSEAELRAVLKIGGVHHVACGSTALSIPLSEPLVITRDITLVSSNEVILNGQNLTRLVIVQPGVRATFDGFLFFSGRQTETNRVDGGIPDTAGAGIYNNQGSVTVLNSRFTGNQVVGVTGGDGQDGSGDDGEAGGDAAGAAIFNLGGQVVVSNAVFELNTVTGGPGGDGGSARTGGLGGNGGNAGDGGSAGGAAIYSQGGRVELFSITFTNNTATGAIAGEAGTPTGSLGFFGRAGEAGDAVGAAVAGVDAEISIFGSAFITNTVRAAQGADGNPGAGRNRGEQGLRGGDAAGGAVYSTGRLWITNSTFFRNSARSGDGGDGGAGSASGFGTEGGDGGDGGFASGGAVENTGEGTIVHCTFAENSVVPGAGGEGGAGSGLGGAGGAGSSGAARGGAIYSGRGEVALANSILAHSTTTIEGNVLDRGGNMATDPNPLIDSFASFRLVNPFLLPLANHGGRTPTMALATNSPAIDRGLAEFCAPVDQRGSNRVGVCDIGAYEVVRPLPSIPSQVFTTNAFQLLRASNEMVLRWPAGFTNLFLQVNTNLSSTNNVWTTVTNSPSLSGTNNLLTIAPDPSRPRAFYRLFANTSPTNAPVVPPPPPAPGGTNDVPAPPAP